MTRTSLERFIAAHGISFAAMKLGRGPHQLERWRDCQDDIPQAVADWLAEWEAAGADQPANDGRAFNGDGAAPPPRLR